MLPIVPPFFASSRQAFAMQFSGHADNRRFREAGIGPAYRVTDADEAALMALHDRYTTIDRRSFRAFLLLIVVVLPLVRMLDNPDINVWVDHGFSRTLFLLPLAYIPATALWARSQLQRRLAGLPVAAPALAWRDANAVLLAAASWPSLLLPVIVMPLALYAFKPAAGDWPMAWTLGLVAFGGYFLLLAWQKHRLQTAPAKLRTE
jgi:hypothetical protein